MSSNVRPATMERITTPALAESFIDQQLAELRQQIGDKKVLLALSGGVDSSVVAALLIKAIGKQLICVHVNHGLLRKGEPEQVIEVFQNQMDANLIYVDAVDRFLDKLAGISDPEQKRKIIGKEFIEVFAEAAARVDAPFLGQGTIYPDILESIPLDGIVIVTTPQDLVSMIVEKAVNMAKLMNIPVLALVENMSYYPCPHCGEKLYPFGKSKLEEEAAKIGVDCTARMPINSQIAEACDSGKVESVKEDALDLVLNKIFTLK